MGTGASKLLEKEIPSWNREHSLEIVPELRNKQLKLLDKFSKDLRMYTIRRTYSSISYNHFFITDGAWIFEFGDGSSVGGALRVSVEQPWKDPELDKQFELTNEVKDRMRRVCGATSYSLGLRNSEHLCRYVFSGTWYSLQMTGEYDLCRGLRKAMKEHYTKVNTEPKELSENAPTTTGGAVIHKQWDSLSTPVKISFEGTCPIMKEQNQRDMNLLVLGPSGAGKSTVINMLFNRKVAKEKANAKSAKRQMVIYYGTAKTGQKQQRLNVIDCVGLCDSVAPLEDVASLTRQFIKGKVVWFTKVLIVCSGRIEKEQVEAVQAFMQWLKYLEYKTEFVFIFNKTESQNSGEKLESLGEMCSILNADPECCDNIPDDTLPGGFLKVNYAIATSFPEGASFEQVHEDMTALHNAAVHVRHDARPIICDLVSAPDNLEQM